MTMTAEEAAATAALFKALADPHRVRIVNLLATSPDPVCVCDLVDVLGLAQPTVSHPWRHPMTATPDSTPTGAPREQIQVTFTHQVADGLHSAIIKATKPATVAAPVRRTELPLADQPTSGCC